MQSGSRSKLLKYIRIRYAIRENLLDCFALGNLTLILSKTAKLKHCWNYTDTWIWSFLFSFSNAETIVYFKLDYVKFLSAETWCESFSPVSSVRKQNEMFPLSFSQLKADVISLYSFSNPETLFWFPQISVSFQKVLVFLHM